MNEEQDYEALVEALWNKARMKIGWGIRRAQDSPEYWAAHDALVVLFRKHRDAHPELIDDPSNHCTCSKETIQYTPCYSCDLMICAACFAGNGEVGEVATCPDCYERGRAEEMADATMDYAKGLVED